MITVLECTGIGAKKFLQGQLTCDVNSLVPHVAQLTACCNLQGRVIFTTEILMENEQSFTLLIPNSMSTIVMAHLNKYATFSRCEIAETQGKNLPQTLDKKQKINRGIPTIYPETSECFIPQRLNLHLIPSAMSFKKGCYLGQEIIARLYFKGALKHHMYLGEIATEADLQIGDIILDDQQESKGQVIDFYQEMNKKKLLFVNALENSTPNVHGNSIKILPLPYDF